MDFGPLEGIMLLIVSLDGSTPLRAVQVREGAGMTVPFSREEGMLGRRTLPVARLASAALEDI